MSQNQGPQALRRSLLFVPGSEPRRLERASSSGADTLLLDLEDSVPPERKAEARDLVASVIRDGGCGDAEPAVRVNAAGGPYLEEDLDAVVGAGAAAVMLPKSQTPDQIVALADRLRALEQRHGRGPVRILALVETALGVVNAVPLATADDRVVAVCFGHADFSLDLGLATADASTGVVYHARCQVAVAAAAAGVEAVDPVCLAVKDEGAFRADADLGAKLGFAGKMCIHPSQVRIANEVFAPTPDQIAQALSVLAQWQEAQAEGRGVISVEGKMVDAPVAAAAQRVLARAERAGVRPS